MKSDNIHSKTVAIKQMIVASVMLFIQMMIYSEYFTKGQEPTRVTIQAPSPIEGIDIEIEVTAILPVGKLSKA